MATARNLIGNALVDIGAFAPGESIPGPQETQALRRLNQMLGGWTLQPLTMTTMGREVFPLVAGKGGTGPTTPTSGPYTIGPGADFNTTRPPALYNVALYNPQPASPNELPRTLYTDDAYQAILIKDFGSPYFSGVYYNATYASGWGTISLWPVPSVDTYSLVIYRLLQVSTFADLTTDYALPPGADDAIEWSLAKILAIPYAKPWTQQLELMANSMKANYERGNTRMVDLSLDPALTAGQGKPWNILSGGSGQ